MPITAATGEFAVRDFADSDYGALVALHRRADPTFQWDEADLRRFDRRSAGLVRLVAEGPAPVRGGTRLLGGGMLTAIGGGSRPQRYKLNLVVDPECRRRGIGGALCGALESAARERGASRWRAEAQETNGAALAFLATRGFVELGRSWESVLDVAAFDPDRFAGAEERVDAAGIAITTLADELGLAGSARVAEAVRRAVHRLEVVAQRDEPSPDPPGSGTPYGAYVRRTLGDPNLLPDGFFLARDGASDGAPLVGLSYLFAAEKQPGVLKQGFTGVLAEYRGRGIATALKLRTARYARERGYRQIRTWNSSRNRPMLRINEALGFAREPVWVALEKDLGREAHEMQTDSHTHATDAGRG